MESCTFNEYLQFLHSIGRRKGCLSEVEKSSDALTIPEQIKLTGLYIQQKCIINTNFFVDKLAAAFISQDDATICQIIKSEFISIFYKDIETYLSSFDEHQNVPI